jgi:hypothetical protein
MSGKIGRIPEDAPCCCYGDPMIALPKEIIVYNEKEVKNEN